MKPYQQIPILECGEALIAIPDEFSRVSPHPYEKLGAPYGNRSPFYLRQGVVDRLFIAQQTLQKNHPNWRIQIFDAYRPVAVQQFMVDYTFLEVAQTQNLTPEKLSDQQRQDLLQQVYQFWAIPSLDSAMPPPHSTGAAIDITLVDETGSAIDMGSPIDEISERSFPDYFAKGSDFSQRRQILNQIMVTVGFKRHWNEWWHFSYGDQIWVWLMRQENLDCPLSAKYGRV